MPDIECPVCLEHIIGPYSLSCGHTICCKCFSLLKNQKCPTCCCLFDKNILSPNFLLESFLRDLIDDYDTLRQVHDIDIKLIRCKTAYRKSTRYHELKEKIIDTLGEHYMTLDDLEHHLDVNVDELHHAINLINALTIINIDDVSYVVNCDTVDTLNSFVAAKADYLHANPHVYLHLISIFTSDEDDASNSLATLAKLCKFDKTVYEKHQLPESETFVAWITDITGLEAHVDDDDESYVAFSI
jgi:hypothetical protein